MLNFFKHSYISQQVAVVLMALALWMPAFITKSAFIPGEHTTPLYNVVVSIFEFSPLMLNFFPVGGGREADPFQAVDHQHGNDGRRENTAQIKDDLRLLVAASEQQASAMSATL